MSAFKNNYYDYTWNFFSGCTECSDACVNCVAKKKIRYLLSTVQSREKYTNDFQFTVHYDSMPSSDLRRTPRTVLVNNVSDTFHPDAPQDFLAEKFIQMIEMELYTFIICTKRPKNMMAFVDMYFGDALLDAPNIILAVSIEKRKYLDRLTILNQIPATRAVFFEPLLEDIGAEPINLEGISRVYAGPEVMPFKKYPIAWYRNLEIQCDIRNIPFILTRPMFREGNFHRGNHRKKYKMENV